MTTNPTDDSATDASAAIPLATYAPPAIPEQGIWVGPEHYPATYERLEHVGGGIEGAVYRARFVGGGQLSTRMVALKEYRRPGGADRNWPHDGTWPHLNYQVNLLTGLPENPHLVHVQGLFLGAVSSALSNALPPTHRVFQTPYLVMEWIDGTPPVAVIDDRPVTLAERIQWVKDLAEAIDLLHSVTRTENNPIVHGDIKPGNCLVNSDRGLVLVDTGAITRLDSEANRRGLCTPPYAAPEVLAAPGQPRTASSDLFSLGAVAYHFLVGEPPPSAEYRAYHQEAQRRLADTAWAEVPDEAAQTLRGLLGEYLSPDPAARARLSPIAWSNHIASVLDATKPAGPGGLRRRARQWTLAAVLALAVTGTAYTLWPGEERQTSPNATALGIGDSDANFVVFGRKWAKFSASVDAGTLSIRTPAGPGQFKHLWGFYDSTEHCATTIDFDLLATPIGANGNFGIGIAPRSTLRDDQPHGYSIQYEWETADMTSRPGPVVRPAELPGGAWSVDVSPTPAPDPKRRRHITVSAVGSTMTISIENREIAAYDLPQVECGGVAIRAWGANATFGNVQVSGT